MNSVIQESGLAPEHVVDNSVYVDPRVYDAEVKNIFRKTWQFTCHVSEVAETGDFMTTTVAGVPIIVARDHDGQVRSYINVCRHRGCKVVLQEAGHASAFRCPYHFWVYSLEGELVGISGEETYEGSGFRAQDHPLIEVACGSVLGLVFIHLGRDPQPLEEWVGADVIERLSRPLANPDLRVIKFHQYDMPINWKIFAENVRDGYHVPFVHPFYRKASPPGPYQLYANGHAVQSLGMEPKGIDPELWARIRRHPLPGIEEGEGYIANFFPDANVTLRSNVVSIDIQRTLAMGQVRMENRTLGLASDTEEIRDIRLESQRVWFQDRVDLEDGPVFLAQQAGLGSGMLPYSVVARGADATTGTRGDDNRLRQFWTEWRELMGTPVNSFDASAA